MYMLIFHLSLLCDSNQSHAVHVGSAVTLLQFIAHGRWSAVFPSQQLWRLQGRCMCGRKAPISGQLRTQLYF